MLTKIGTKQNVTDEGLCRAVLDKCQRYTYDSKGNYESYNDVVVNYVQRAMTNIRAAQSAIISEYASTCMLDVADCYNQQVSQVNSWSTSASVSSIYQVMRGACRNVALTCAYAVFDNCGMVSNKFTCKCYVEGSMLKCGDTPSDADEADEATLINEISQMFYQSLLCPDNSTYTATPGTAEEGYVNTNCKCAGGYEPWGGACVAKCDELAERVSSGTCVCKNTNHTMSNGICTPKTITVSDTATITNTCKNNTDETSCKRQSVTCTVGDNQSTTNACTWSGDSCSALTTGICYTTLENEQESAQDPAE